MKNKNINKIRKKLDSLDDKLLNILKKRSDLVNKILREKKSKKEIIDKKRIKVILKRIKQKSQKKKIDTDLSKKIWTAMIQGFINYEFRNFKKKK
tara:strand:- start:345 stop:629 length:285 start_codon:yes stop_codon:yes gene_type:complete